MKAQDLWWGKLKALTFQIWIPLSEDLEVLEMLSVKQKLGKEAKLIIWVNVLFSAKLTDFHWVKNKVYEKLGKYSVILMKIFQTLGSAYNNIQNILKFFFAFNKFPLESSPNVLSHPTRLSPAFFSASRLKVLLNKKLLRRSCQKTPKISSKYYKNLKSLWGVLVLGKY